MKERQVNSKRGLAPELPGARPHFLTQLRLLMEQRS